MPDSVIVSGKRTSNRGAYTLSAAGCDTEPPMGLTSSMQCQHRRAAPQPPSWARRPRPALGGYPTRNLPTRSKTRAPSAYASSEGTP